MGRFIHTFIYAICHVLLMIINEKLIKHIQKHDLSTLTCEYCGQKFPDFKARFMDNFLIGRSLSYVNCICPHCGMINQVCYLMVPYSIGKPGMATLSEELE